MTPLLALLDDIAAYMGLGRLDWREALGAVCFFIVMAELFVTFFVAL